MKHENIAKVDVGFNIAKWVLSLAAIGFACYMLSQGDARYVMKDNYDRDQRRIERQLDVIAGDVKELLKTQGNQK